MDNNAINDDILQDNIPLPDMPETTDEDEIFRKPKKIFRNRNILIAVIAVLSICLIAGIIILCVTFFGHSKYDDSAAFYFASDLLSENGGDFTAYDKIEFNIYNYADALRISREPVKSFDVRVEADGKNITDKADIVTGETEMKADVRSACNVTIDVPKEYLEQKIKVIVTSSPIEKQISGTFTLKPKWGYEIKDSKGSVCAELVIFANKDVLLDLSWDKEALTADNTNTFVHSMEHGGDVCRIQLSGGTSTMIPMFKIDAARDYSESEKVLTLEEVQINRGDDSDSKNETQTKNVNE